MFPLYIIHSITQNRAYHNYSNSIHLYVHLGQLTSMVDINTTNYISICATPKDGSVTG